VIIAFADMAAVDAFLDSEAYAPVGRYDANSPT
jgi:uncharacterized protein (DUF1330 family)